MTLETGIVISRPMIALALLASTSNAAQTEPTPPSDPDTVRRSPAVRTVPLAPTLRFEPQGDITTQELEQLGPYLKGKPLYEDDRKALGPAARHLKEVK
jgi:DMSO/TMAO reductase YedYZ molybdopterin-dependent catalytic subunit